MSHYAILTITQSICILLPGRRGTLSQFRFETPKDAAVNARRLFIT